MTHSMPSRQRGIATLIVVLLLITGVFFLLSQSTTIVQQRSGNSAQDLDSQAAELIAESGIQRAQSIVTTAQLAGAMSNTVCSTGVSTGSPITIGRGQLSYASTSGVTSPASCASDTCSTCTVQAVGTVGNATRTLNAQFKMGTVYGVAGRGSTVTMVLSNTFNAPTIALFELGWRRQGQGGNAGGTGSTPVISTGGTSVITWNVLSSSGTNSVGAIGTAVPIPAGSTSPVLTQTLSASRDYVEVGGLYPAQNPSDPYPLLLGSYWSDINNSPITATQNGSSGAVTSGVDTTNGTGCSAAPNPATGKGTGTQQNCTQWCLDPSASSSPGKADTLVMGVSAGSQAVSDQINSIAFNGSQLNPLVHFPNTDGSTRTASGALFSEQWFYYNQPYTSSRTGVGATMYPNTSVVSAGASVTFKSDVTTASFTAKNLTGYICVNDILSNLSGNPQVLKVPGGGNCSNLTGDANTYTLDKAPGGNVKAGNTTLIPSSKLILTGLLGTDLAGGKSYTYKTQTQTSSATTVGTVTVNSASPTSALSYYSFPSAMFYPTTVLYSGSKTSTTGNVNGASQTLWTVYLPSADETMPLDPYTYTDSQTGSSVYVDTQLQIYKSLGASYGSLLPQGTHVAAVNRSSRTMTIYVSAGGPSPDFRGVQLCGGACALFNDPGNVSGASPGTPFTINASMTINQWQWASGFMCLSGVYRPNIQKVQSAAVTDRQWWESVK